MLYWYDCPSLDLRLYVLFKHWGEHIRQWVWTWSVWLSDTFLKIRWISHLFCRKLWCKHLYVKKQASGMDEVHSVSLFGEITCLNAHGADVFVFMLDTLHAFKTRDPYFGLMQNDCSDHKSIISKMLLKVKFALLAAANQAMHCCLWNLSFLLLFPVWKAQNQNLLYWVHMYVYAYKELGIQNSFSAVNILIRIDITVICTVVSNYNIAAHHSDEFQNEFLTCTI